MSGGSDGAVKVWNTKSKHCMYDLEAHGGGEAIYAVRFDDKKVTAGTASGALKIWNFSEKMDY